jgi:hypothetical protein
MGLGVECITVAGLAFRAGFRGNLRETATKFRTALSQAQTLGECGSKWSLDLSFVVHGPKKWSLEFAASASFNFRPAALQ